MAEFNCYKKYCNLNAKKENLILDAELDLCEGCGEYKTEIVIAVRQRTIFDDFIH